jgi:Ran GTPase-activating protein (RanGAP) involved in mRNA processing and transport
MNDPDLKMRHHGLGAPGIKPVAVALTTNTRVVKLDISDNWLGSMGAEHICKMMKDNCYITELVSARRSIFATKNPRLLNCLEFVRQPFGNPRIYTHL